MEILLLVVAWLLVGCGVAWVIGSAASMSNVPVGQDPSQHGAVGNIDHVSPGERVPDHTANELAVNGTDRRRLRSI